MNFRRSALASAISLAVAAPAGAAVTIEQRIEQLLEQTASNLVELESGLQVSVGLDLEGNVAASTQLGSLQANVIGWGTSGGSATSALDVTGVEFIDINQSIQDDLVVLESIPSPRGPAAEPLLEQDVSNVVLAAVTFNRVANVDLRAISQIGVNVGNATALNLDGDVRVTVEQDAEFADIDRPLGYQSVENMIRSSVNLGQVTVDGGYLADPDDEELTRSIQLGSSTLNAVQVNSIGEQSGDITIAFDQDLEDGAFLSGNQILVLAENDGLPPRLDTDFGGSIFNTDQIVLVTQNNLSVTLDPTGTLQLLGDDDAVQGLDPGEFDLANEMVAGVNGAFDGGFYGNPAGSEGIAVDDFLNVSGVDRFMRQRDAEGFGDFDIDSVAQTLVVNLNGVNIAGPTVDEVTSAAGDTTVGLLDDVGEVQTFEQDLGALSLGIEDELFSNNLFAFTGVGDAAVTDFAQTGAVSANTFSTSGNLAGVSLQSTDYYPGTVGEGNYGEFLTDLEIEDALDAEGDRRLNADVSQQVSTVDIELLNVAGSFTGDTGTASLGGSQIGSVTLNSLSVAGNGSGFFTQGNDGAVDVNLINTAFAGVEDRGTAVSGSLSQTGVASLNVMGFGSLSSAILYQSTESNEVDLAFDNSLAVGGVDSRIEMASLQDVTQAVISRVNAISAINVN